VDDAEAFGRLYEAESEAVLIFLVRRTLDVETAVELTAETFAVALTSWRTLGRLGPEQSRAWLFTVARRRYGRYLRRAQSERRMVERLGVRVPMVDETDVAMIEERAGLGELRRVIARELERLSADQRQAVRLRIVEERSYEEIAGELGVTEATARARVSRGLRRLASAIAPYRDQMTEVVS
jgi:RNA polymerase sigma factor (sigma-70 family)